MILEMISVYVAGIFVGICGTLLWRDITAARNFLKNIEERDKREQI